MIRKKLIDWITYVLNMLVALPVTGLISAAAAYLFCYMLFGAAMQSWIFLSIVVPLDILLLICWGRYQYWAIIRQTPPSRREILSQLCLFGIIIGIFALPWGTVAALKYYRQMKYPQYLTRFFKEETGEIRLKTTLIPEQPAIPLTQERFSKLAPVFFDTVPRPIIFKRKWMVMAQLHNRSVLTVYDDMKGKAIIELYDCCYELKSSTIEFRKILYEISSRNWKEEKK